MVDDRIVNHSEPNGTFPDVPDCSVNGQRCPDQGEPGETTPLLKHCSEYSGGPSTDISPAGSRITRRQLTLVILTIYGNFWISTCYSLLAPFFPDEAKKKGASSTVYGLIFGVFQLTLFVTGPLYGKILPIVSPRFLLVSGMFVSSACSILFGVIYYSPVGPPFIGSAFAVRIVEALGTSAYYVSALTIVSSEFRENRATVLALLESATGVGFIVGPTVGGPLYQAGGYTTPFFVLGGILFVGSIAAAFITPYSEQLGETGNLCVLMTKRRLYVHWLILTFCFFVIGYNEATLSDHLHVFKLNIIVVSSIFIVPGGLYALGSPIWGHLCDKRIKPEICGFIGSILIAVSYLFLGPVPFLGLRTKLWMVIMSLVLLGIGIGGLLISSFILSLNISIKEGLPDDVTTLGLVCGVFASTSSLGAAIGPSTGGVMLDYMGYENSTVVVFGISAFMVVVVLVNMICSFSRNQERGNEVEQTVSC